MRKLLTFLIVAASFVSNAQNDTGIPIPMKNGIIFYEKEYLLDHAISKGQLYEKAYAWFIKTFDGVENNIKIADKKNGRLIGEGAFRIDVNENGNYYWLKPVIEISVKDGAYSFQSYNYYEKPIEKGITNDYSKIEYRWWDFRKGKPWSSEDKKLFEGLDQTTLSLMASLEKDMTK
ncbi:MAG: DUF4468 domain-containing protein [Bacteroidetes bacterium]|nr:DUF4468 domain-containing protein [Bacteroidota bacterium]